MLLESINMKHIDTVTLFLTSAMQTIYNFHS